MESFRLTQDLEPALPCAPMSAQNLQNMRRWQAEGVGSFTRRNNFHTAITCLFCQLAQRNDHSMFKAPEHRRDPALCPIEGSLQSAVQPLALRNTSTGWAAALQLMVFAGESDQNAPILAHAIRIRLRPYKRGTRLGGLATRRRRWPGREKRES